MTREELERGVDDILCNRVSLPHDRARLIRLVVEACSARVRSVLGPPSGPVVGMDLESTFLPQEKPDA